MYLTSTNHLVFLRNLHYSLFYATYEELLPNLAKKSTITPCMRRITYGLSS